jgi:L-arabinonolactonase
VEGQLWSAHWGSGRIVRYGPDGSISGVIEVPASQPTCIAFGGRALDEGLDASALPREPHAGNLLVYAVNVRGLPDPPFAQAAPSAGG